MTSSRPVRIARAAGQIALGAALAFAGTTHLTVARNEFQAQVPSWFPADPDAVVLVSGVIEIGLGVALLTLWKQPGRAWLGATTAAFFVAIFPGNIAQFVEGKDGFGLNSDQARFVRLLFQPLLVVGALAATDAVGTLRRRRAGVRP